MLIVFPNIVINTHQPVFLVCNTKITWVQILETVWKLFWTRWASLVIQLFHICKCSSRFIHWCNIHVAVNFVSFFNFIRAFSVLHICCVAFVLSYSLYCYVDIYCFPGRKWNYLLVNDSQNSVLLVCWLLLN